MRTYKILVLFFIGLCLCSSPVFARQPIIIGSDAAPPLSTTEQTGMLDLLVKEAFSRIGEKVIITPLPSERSLINANRGINDGDLVRINGMDRQYPNLVKVPEKICNFEFVAFSKNRDLKLSDWESLKPFSVGIITGWKILEKNVQSEILTMVEKPELLFKLIINNRADMVIYNRHEGYGVIKTMNLQGIHVIEPPLKIREMFLYLNKKHLKLIPRLAKALGEMKKDGTFSAIVNKSLKPYLP
ncbi:MAG: amino acid ABC transporter substrate-binding protein [Desulfobacteraceae bacterium]|nr:amino acid ABC transporter substrate-binding protein [Desulfobacteraceae bacterium]